MMVLMRGWHLLLLGLLSWLSPEWLRGDLKEWDSVMTGLRGGNSYKVGLTDLI